MQRNIYFDLITVLLLLAAGGYYLIPWLWGKLELKGNISVEGENNCFSLSPGNFALAGLILIGLYFFLSFFTWGASFSFGYFQSVAIDSTPSMGGIYSYLFLMVIAGFCLLGIGIGLIVLAPYLLQFLFKNPESQLPARKELNNVFRLMLQGISLWLILYNLPRITARFILWIPEISFIFSFPRGGSGLNLLQMVDPFVMHRLLSMFFGSVIFIFTGALSNILSERYHRILTEASDVSGR